MTVSEMGSALLQLRDLAAQASGGEALHRIARSGSADTFTSALYRSIQEINRLKLISDSKGRAFEAGDPNVSLQEVMIAGQKASIAFEMAVQTRNRLLTAYKEVMNMQV